MHSRYKKASSRIAKRNQFKRIFRSILIVGLPAASLVGLIFLARASFLQVQSFELEGDAALRAEIKDAALSFIAGNKFWIFPKSNILFLDKENLSAALLGEFTRLEKVEIDRRLFEKKAVITLKEREAEFIWCGKDQNYFFMSGDGLIFEKINDSSAAFLESGTIIFRGEIEGDALLQRFAEPEGMENYKKAIKIFEEAKIKVISIDLELPDKAVFLTEIGRIFLNPEEDLSPAASNAVILVSDLKTKNTSLYFDYLDARFGNKVFYKLI